MQKTPQQLYLVIFYFPFGGKRSYDDLLGKLARSIPRKLVESFSSEHFSINISEGGTNSACVALGALLIKRFLICSDKEIFELICKSSYGQFFFSFHDLRGAVFFDSTLDIHSCRWRILKRLKQVNEIIILSKKRKRGSACVFFSRSKEVILQSFTCLQSDTSFPDDINVVNKAWEKSGLSIRNLVSLLKQICSKIKSYHCKMLRTQFGCVRLHLITFTQISSEVSVHFFSTLHSRNQLVIKQVVYRLQGLIHVNSSSCLSDRIVSISSFFVLPFFSGNASVPAEFGAWVTLSPSFVDGRVQDALSYDAHTENDDQQRQETELPDLRFFLGTSTSTSS